MRFSLAPTAPCPCGAKEEWLSLPFPERGLIWDELNQSAFAEAARSFSCLSVRTPIPHLQSFVDDDFAPDMKQRCPWFWQRELNDN